MNATRSRSRVCKPLTTRGSIHPPHFLHTPLELLPHPLTAQSNGGGNPCVSCWVSNEALQRRISDCSAVPCALHERYTTTLQRGQLTVAGGFWEISRQIPMQLWMGKGWSSVGSMNILGRQASINCLSGIFFLTVLHSESVMIRCCDV